MQRGRQGRVCEMPQGPQRTSGWAVAMLSNWARSMQSARDGCRATTRKRRGCRWMKSIAPVTVPGPNVKLLRRSSSSA